MAEGELGSRRTVAGNARAAGCVRWLQARRERVEIAGCRPELIWCGGELGSAGTQSTWVWIEAAHNGWNWAPWQGTVGKGELNHSSPCSIPVHNTHHLQMTIQDHDLTNQSIKPNSSESSSIKQLPTSVHQAFALPNRCWLHRHTHKKSFRHPPIPSWLPPSSSVAGDQNPPWLPPLSSAAWDGGIPELGSRKK